MTRALLVVLLVSCSSGTSAPSKEECDQVAAEIREKAGSRSNGICASTVKADVDRFGQACAILRQCGAQ